MTKPSIAILGLEGSGKTVLMTVLAKKLSMTVDEGVYLEPIGIPTLKRVESTWTTLQSGKWPPSTPPGEMFSLHWVLHIERNNQKIDADIRLVDLAGQDTRQLFSHDDFRNTAPVHLRPLAEYLSNTSIVLLVLNIKDYIAETDVERRIDNQAVLKSALDQLSGSKDILLIFTQLDQYEDFLNDCGGLDVFCQRYLPYIYNSYIRTKHLPVLCLAAVADTRVDFSSEDGIARRIPMPNFTSRGLDELQKWLVNQICTSHEQESQEQEKLPSVPQEWEPWRPEQEQRKPEWVWQRPEWELRREECELQRQEQARQDEASRNAEQEHKRHEQEWLGQQKQKREEQKPQKKQELKRQIWEKREQQFANMCLGIVFGGMIGSVAGLVIGGQYGNVYGIFMGFGTVIGAVIGVGLAIKSK